MKMRYLSILAAGLLIAAHAHADEALAKKSNCMTCHTVEKKGVGPAFKAIAAKYKGDATAADKLAKKVRSGGAGSFGTMAMPPTGKNVSDDDIKTLVGWILSL